MSSAGCDQAEEPADDDDAVTATEHDVKSLGEIKIEIRRYLSVGDHDQVPVRFSQSIRPPPTMHEMSKKAQLKHTSAYVRVKLSPLLTLQLRRAPGLHYDDAQSHDARPA